MTSVSWGGCLEVIEWVLTAGQFPVDAGVLDGGVLILETSEELLPARNVGLDASAAMLAIAAVGWGPEYAFTGAI